MALLSIPFLPESFAVLETYIARIFLLLGLISIGPWAALLFYDLVLYVCRACAHEMPVIGGRARGKARPRAPSLTERPSGRRNFSFASRALDRPVVSTGSTNAESQDDARQRRTAGNN